MTNLLLKSPDVVFIHIPKTGGTSIRQKWDTPRAPRTFGFIPKEWKGVPSFAIVRDPLDRFLSAVRMFKYGCNLPGDYYEIPRWPDLSVDQAIVTLFSEHVPYDRSVRTIEASLRHHLLPQTHPFNCLDLADDVLRFETLADDFTGLASRLKISPDLPVARNTDTERGAELRLNDEQREVLLELYAEDIQSLGYDQPARVLNIPRRSRESFVWDKWPAYFSAAAVDAKDADAALPDNTVDLEVFRRARLLGRRGPTWAKRNADLIAHFHNLQPEFAGASYLTFLLACTIVVIRRTSGAGPGLALFWRILDEHGDLIAKETNLRWLTSICDTMADHGTTAEQSILGVLGSTLVNIIKLYETELRTFYPRRPPKANRAIRKGGALFDGTITFWPERGDMIDNLLRRIAKASERDKTSAILLTEMVRRLSRRHSAIARFRALNGKSPFPIADQERVAELESLFGDVSFKEDDPSGSADEPSS